MSDNALLGMWWFARNDDEKVTKVTGVLRDAETNRAQLEILSDLMHEQPDRHPLILEEANGDRYSLVNSSRTKLKNRFASSMSSSEVWHFDHIVRGAHLDCRDEVFARLSFSVEGIQEWSQLTGFTKALIQRGNKPEFEHEITRVPPEPLRFTADAMDIVVRSTFNDIGQKWGVDIREDSQIIVSTSKARTLSQWKNDVIVPMQRLIQLALKNGGTIRRVSVSPKLNGNNRLEGREGWFRWYGTWMKDYPFDGRRSPLERPLFTAQSLHNISDSLQKWFDFHKRHESALEALLDLRLGSPTSEYRFFTTARLSERLQERFPSAELFSKKTLSEMKGRVHDLLSADNREEFFQKLAMARRSNSRTQLSSTLSQWQPYIEPLASHPDMLEWVAGRILSTRNCFAHHDPETCKKAAMGYELHCLEMLLRTVVDAEVCRHLGFSASLVNQELNDSSQYRTGKDLAQFYALSREGTAEKV